MSDIAELAQRHGLQSCYIDASGQQKQVPEHAIRLIVDCLGECPSSNRLPKCVVLRQGQRLELSQLDGQDKWVLTEEGGKIHEGRTDAPFPALPLGYHRLELRSSGNSDAISVIVCPPQCYLPLVDGKAPRVWGIASQLYSLRSQRNYGIGDFSDLAKLVEIAAELGASLVGISPLHALFPDEPERASPYSPSSRRFLNWLYLDVEAVPEFRESAAAQAIIAKREGAAELTRLRGSVVVDYPGVTRLKREVLQATYESFRAQHFSSHDDRARAFEEFRRNKGIALRRFALFNVLRERLGSSHPELRDWRRWPDEFSNPAASGIAGLEHEAIVEIEFHEYLQFLAAEQLAAVAGGTRARRLSVGLYGDLAIGIDPASADAWSDQDVIAPGLSIGAPPDIFNPRGQNWGLSLFKPAALKESGYAPFIELVRTGMRGFGALRIDHALGLVRLYCIPETGCADGAYVQFPFDDLTGIIALESQRNRCMVIAEDLGTLPEGARERFAEAGLLSYRLLWFENEEGKFIAPEDYPEQALVAVSTHDLPTIAGYWSGEDIDVRRSLDLMPEEQEKPTRRDRSRDKASLLKLLSEASLAPPPASETPPIADLHGLLARAPSRLMLVQLEDVLGLREQMNMPGTTDQQPNWRRRLPMAMSDLPNTPLMQDIARLIQRENR